MKVKAGPLRRVGTDGRELFIDIDLTPQQVDFLYRLMDGSGRDPDDVSAIEVTEAGVVFTPVDVEADQ